MSTQKQNGHVEPEGTLAQATEGGLTKKEYEQILSIVGRTPTQTELGLFSAMWSEHCSYKSSRRLLKMLPTRGPRVAQGPGENAGAIDIGDGQVAVFKMESHNHPSYIEPFQGAATGVGGILRDVFTMGARPVASLNALRFGSPTHPRTRYLVENVVAGIGFYGNCIGVPTVGGDVAFSKCYDGNILVNAMTVGVAEKARLFLGRAEGVGNPVLYVGSKTGRDGIHGATMASAEFGSDAEAKRPTVQVGDPFTEKLLLEACLELMSTDLIVGIQDMGAAGLTSSSIEMAARAGSGIVLDLDRVPCRAAEMTPYEIMLSESQERMLLVLRKGTDAEKQAQAIFDKWGLDCVRIGEVTSSGKVVLKWHGKVVADLAVDPLAEGLVYERPAAPPKTPFAPALNLASLAIPQDLGATLLALLGSPTVASKEWVYRQYDTQVGNMTVLTPGISDAAIVRVLGPTGQQKGLAVSVDCNSRLCFIDPYEGAKLAVCEAARNVVCVGGEPVGLTDCLNFGNPERPEIAWQLEQAIKGIRDACEALSIPVVSGNVSLYNETEGKAIYPTPMIGMLGLLPDVTRHVPQAFQGDGDVIALVGAGEAALGGSEYLELVHQQVAGALAPVDLADEKALQAACLDLIGNGLVKSAHDLSEGGLAVALAESAICGKMPVGVEVTLPAASSASGGAERIDSRLFGEGPSRILISFAPDKAAQVEACLAKHEVPIARLGHTGGRSLTLKYPASSASESVSGGQISLPLARVLAAHKEGFGRHVGVG